MICAFQEMIEKEEFEEMGKKKFKNNNWWLRIESNQMKKKINKLNLIISMVKKKDQ